MNATLLVMVGGAVGAAARYHVGRLCSETLGAQYPYGTLVVNVAGGLAMGLLAGWLARHDMPNEPWRLLIGVGVLGGFTTFSAFSLEVVKMIERGAWGTSVGYVILSVVASILALACGLFLMRQVA